MLIAEDHAELHCSLAEIRGQQGEPIDRLTKLGWTCVRVTTPSKLSNPKRAAFLEHSFVASPSKANIELSNLVQQIWEIDQPPLGVSCSNITSQEEEAYRTARATIKQTNGRYSIGIPWRDSNISLPDSYNNAVRRLLCTEKRLIREQLARESYMAVIQEYLSERYSRLIGNEAEPGKGWCLPHFPIVKPSSTTTKTRIVFDASVKVEGVSLNDVIHTGLKLQGDLFEILVRFRKESVALVSDITQMHLQIELPEHERPYHRFSWRYLVQSAPSQIYEINRGFFAISASPFPAQFVSQEHARQHTDQYPLAAEVVLKSTNMDDDVASVKDEDTGKETYHQMSQLWESAGMPARK